MTENATVEFRLKNSWGKKDIKKQNIMNFGKNKTKWIDKYEAQKNMFLNYVEHRLLLSLTVPGCVFIYGLASLVAAPVGTKSTAVELTNLWIIAGIKIIYQLSKVWKNEENLEKIKTDNKIVFFGKSKFDIINVLFSKFLIDS